MTPTVSVIITTYKRPLSLVRRAVESVMNQTWKDKEIIIVDDNSDEDMHIYNLKSLEQIYSDCNLRYISYPGNHGACYARNVGLSSALGQYIAYLDDDDEWIPEKLEKQIKLMRNPEVALVYCSALVKNDITGELSHFKRCKYRGWIYPDLIMENFICSTSVSLLRKDSVEKVGAFDVKMPSSQDYDLWLRLSKEYEVDYVDEELVIYYVHGGERITTDLDKKMAGLSRINEKNKDYLEQNKIALWYRSIKLSPFYARKGKLLKGLIIWGKSACICPLKMKINMKYLFLVFLWYYRFVKALLG